MGAFAQHRRHQRLDGGAEGGAPADEPRGRPFQMLLMTVRHVSRDRGVPSAAEVAEMDRDPLTVVEDLDGARGGSELEALLSEREGHAVAVALEFDVVVDIGADPFPAAGLEARGRQRSHRGVIEREEERASTGAVMPHHAVVELVEEVPNPPIEGAEADGRLVTQPRQDPALGHLDPDLDFGFVSRTGRPRRKHHRPVMPGEFLVAPLQLGLVATGARHAGFQLVGHHGGRHPPDKLEGPDVTA